MNVYPRGHTPVYVPWPLLIKTYRTDRSISSGKYLFPLFRDFLSYTSSYFQTPPIFILCNEAPLATKLYCILKYLLCDIGKVLNGIEIPKSRERGLGIQKKERGNDPICPRTCRAASGTMKLAGKRLRIIL